ncbi:hypothetical protein [Marinilabilia salmonicolor]|uniref:hypothetical protein n=1 Tax=Marinilabilia salmonicolor TaxID=989 RepID=UPI00029A4E14|nr:hypothetical protein [Marinilabilia salmonicolor]
MTKEIIDNIIFLITGAAIPIIISLINNYTQGKRDIQKFKNDRISQQEKRKFEVQNEYKLFLRQSIEEIITLLGLLKHAVSITSSIIHSKKNISINEYDELYEKEVERLIKLKTLILTRFPEFSNKISSIEGCHNRYWGEQRMLLLINPKTELGEFQTKMERIFPITEETSNSIDMLIKELIKHSESIKKYNAT